MLSNQGAVVRTRIRSVTSENCLSVRNVVDDDISVDVDSGRIAGGSRLRWGWREARRLVRGRLFKLSGSCDSNRRGEMSCSREGTRDVEAQVEVGSSGGSNERRKMEMEME